MPPEDCFSEIDLPPYAPVLMESTRAIGYSMPTAIADIIDNSISANASNVEIEFRPGDSPYIYILDDGCGMSSDKVTTAMQYGSKNPSDTREPFDLGRFGLGLKTASLSQCRCLTVVTIKDGRLSARQWDLDVIVDRKKWTLLALHDEYIWALPGIDRLMANEHGTLVIWEKFDRLIAGTVSLSESIGKLMIEVRKHLSLVFHRYLTGEIGAKKIRISINKTAVIPIDPFLISRSEQIMDIEPVRIQDSLITVTPYILPHLSRLSVEEKELLGGEDGFRRKQGFYVYRNKRLLIWGTWFGMLRKDEFYKLARVKVDIPNSVDDLWNLDIKKSTAVPPDVVRKNLIRLVRQIAQGSKRTWTFRKRIEIRPEVGHTWERCMTREGVSYVINRNHPLIESFSAGLDRENVIALEKVLSLVENGLPLNALHVDMTEDEVFDIRFDNEEEIYNLVHSVLQNESRSEKLNKLRQLESFDPFCNYPELIKRMINEVEYNEPANAEH